MLVDIATVVPASLTAALVVHGRLLGSVRRLLQIVSWKTSWYDACLLIAAWWTLCLSSTCLLRWLLPFLLALLLSSYKPSPPPTTTEKSLQNVVSDLTIINALLPTAPALPPPLTLFRVAAVSYLPYLLVIYTVPLSIVFAVSGTLVLTARAPFTPLIISTLSRSAYLRHVSRYLLSLLLGIPLPPTVLSHHPTPTSPEPVPALRFLFTIHENQRWWMGLDWTAALLPNERPSWSSPPPTHAPVSPPNVFTLPSSTTVFLPDGTGRRLKRTAIWRWEEPEWRVIVRRDGALPSRVERPIPEENFDPVPETTGSRLLKVAGKMRESSMTSKDTTNPPPPSQNPGMEDVHEDYAEEEDNVATDADGWIYGDNKWEGSSSKGGMSKYTRYRRWTRVAIVSETVQIVEDGPVGIERPDPRPPPKDPVQTPEVLPTPGEEIHAVGTITASPPEEESPLRQRLRRALSKSSDNQRDHP